MLSRRHLPSAALLVLVALPACGGDSVSDEDSARLAYVGLDRSVERGIQLGMAGFNAADNANIPAQSANGDATGSMTVSGKVDQGASANKTMNLAVALAGYSDGEFEDAQVTYDTDAAAPPALAIKLAKIPDGTFSASYAGTFAMRGDLEGEVTLDLTLSGEMRAVGGSASDIERVPGTTQVVGTATSAYGTYDVSVTR